MDSEIYQLTTNAHFNALRATRRGDIADAERWMRLADRYATTLLKLERFLDARNTRHAGKRR